MPGVGGVESYMTGIELQLPGAREHHIGIGIDERILSRLCCFPKRTCMIAIGVEVGLGIKIIHVNIVNAEAERGELVGALGVVAPLK